MKRLALTLVALATLTPMTAMAQRYDNRYEFRGYDRGGNPVYSYHDRRYNRDWRDDRRYDRRDYRQCRDGTTGTVVGAIAGGLLGRTIDTRGDRTLGTIVGAGGGALAGRALDRNCR